MSGCSGRGRRVLRMCVVSLGCAWMASAVASEQKPYVSSRARVIEQYCVTCHNPRTNAGGLRLDAVDVDAVERDPPVWEKVVRKLRAGVMPPVGMPRPADG